MMTKLTNPIRMTDDEAAKMFYPNSYLMINCVRDDVLTGIVEGDVVAYAPAREQTPMSDWSSELISSKKYGRVMVMNTIDPIDGGALFNEVYLDEQK